MLTAVTVACTVILMTQEALTVLQSSLLLSCIVLLSEQASANRCLVHKGLTTLFFITYSTVITHFK